MKKHIIPIWLYYTSLFIMALGLTQVISGNLIWGVTVEGNIALVLTIIFLIIIVFDGVGVLIKKEK